MRPEKIVVELPQMAEHQIEKEVTANEIVAIYSQIRVRSRAVNEMMAKACPLPAGQEIRIISLVICLSQPEVAITPARTVEKTRAN